MQNDLIFMENRTPQHTHTQAREQESKTNVERYDSETSRISREQLIVCNWQPAAAFQPSLRTLHQQIIYQIAELRIFFCLFALSLIAVCQLSVGNTERAGERLRAVAE